MELKLSNYEIRAYRKKDGRVSLHLRTHILFKTNTSFSVDAYLKDIRGYITVQDNTLEFDSVNISVHAAAPYNGKYLLHELYASIITDLKKIGTCIAKLTFVYVFNFHGAEIKGKYENEAVIRRMF